ncbi:MAG: hypothetical protein K9L17_04820 [Clostridiales bacterium]|nr:hypothetical protein [Clostridiales bacterium]MCF8021997.1 hypothetical protein [Clostridiales bacterium]
MPRKYFVITIFCLIFLFSYCYQANSCQNNLNTTKKNIEWVIKGAIEDVSWMKAKKRQEVKNILSKYFTGALHKKLVKDTWHFVYQNTDWYKKANLLEVNYTCIDEKEATVIVYISEVDIINNIVAPLMYEMSLKNTSNGWRIIKMSIKKDMIRYY